MEKYEKVLNLISYAKNPKLSYGGSKYEYGYHSLEIGDLKLEGQRDNEKRISLIPYDFNNKIVLDVGCGPGGMLHQLSKIIKYGVGIDRDWRQINIANVVKHINNEQSLHFYVMDLMIEPVKIIYDLLLDYQHVDICFFLSLAKWIKN
jgi:SAM-dependent methyltransferase